MVLSATAAALDPDNPGYIIISIGAGRVGVGTPGGVKAQPAARFDVVQLQSGVVPGFRVQTPGSDSFAHEFVSAVFAVPTVDKGQIINFNADDGTFLHFFNHNESAPGKAFFCFDYGTVSHQLAEKGALFGGSTTPAATLEVQSLDDNQPMLALSIPEDQQESSFLIQDSIGTKLVTFDRRGNLASFGTTTTLNGLKPPTGLAVTRIGASGSTSYGYAVAAVNAQGATIASAVVTLASGFATLDSTHKNKLDWNPVDGAASYSIYGRDGSNLQFIVNVPAADAPTWTDDGSIASATVLPVYLGLTIFNPGVGPQGTPGTTAYEYCVVAYNVSNVAIGVGLCSTPIGNATLSSTNYNMLTWSDMTASSYKIYGRTHASLLLMATITVPTFNDLGNITPSGALPANTLAPGLANFSVAPVNATGTTGYQYWITAINNVGAVIGYSNFIIRNGVASLNASTYNSLDWDAFASAVSYNIYGRSLGSVSLIANVASPTTAWNDTGVNQPAGTITNTPGTTYIVQAWKTQVNDIAQYQSGDNVSLVKIDPYGHFYLAAGQPTFTPNTGAGTGPSGIFVRGSDQSGTLSFTTGSTPAATATIGTINFENRFASVPRSVLLFPGNLATAQAMNAGHVYVDNATLSTSSFTIKNGTPGLTASTVYVFFYKVEG